MSKRMTACALARRLGSWAVLGVLCAPTLPLRAQEARLKAAPAGATLELLATAVGVASRREPISVLGRALNCDASSAALDSASVQACVTLLPYEATLLLATYARALGRAPMGDWPSDLADELPVCEGREEGTGHSRRGVPPRDRFARISAPVVGERDEQWEGRITIELSCRVLGEHGRAAIRTIATEYLCQWDGRAWALYQVASRRVSG